MKTHRQSLLHFASILILTLLSLSCQKPIEPNPKNIVTSVTIVVRDQSGNPLPGSIVTIRSDEESSLQSTSTNQYGEAIFSLTVPPEGLNHTMTARILPSGDFIGLHDSLLQQSLIRLVPCSGGTFDFIFTGQKSVQCNSDITETLLIKLCTDQGQTTATATTPYLQHQCDSALTQVSLSTSVNLTDPDLGLTIATNPAPLNRIAPGDKFQIRVTTTPRRDFNPAINGTITLTATGPGGTKLAVYVQVQLSAMKCEQCDCPSSMAVYYPDPAQATRMDSVCIGDTKDLTIPLSLFKNQNRGGCAYIFSIAQDFRTSDFTLVSFNNNNMTLGPQQALSSMHVTFSPKSIGTSRDSIEFSISRLDSLGHNRPCSERLRIVVEGFGIGPQCAIQMLPASDSTNVWNDSTFQQCVGQKDPNQIKYLTVINTGRCKLTLDPKIIGDTTFRISPTNVDLLPGQSRKFMIEFLPTSADVYINGNRISPKTTFSAQLQLNGCQPITKSLVGNAIISCQNRPVPFDLHEWGQSQKYYQAAIVNRSSNQVSTSNDPGLINPDQNGFKQRGIYVDKIDLAQKNATICSEYAVYQIVENVSGAAALGKDACSFTRWISTHCPPPAGTSCVTVSEGDVVIIKITYVDNPGISYCGILWIGKIEPDTGGVPIVRFDVCYPF